MTIRLLRPAGFRPIVRHMRGLILLLIAAAISGCGAITPPPHRVDLSEGQWSIESIDGRMLTTDDPLLATFGLDDMRLETGCGTWTGPLVMDSDGAALSFGPLSREETRPCGDEDEAASVVQVLEGIESWSVEAGDRLEFIGSERLTLVRHP